MVFRKLRNLVSRQAQAAAFKETQMLNYHQQPEPVLVCSPSSPPTVDGLPGTVVTNKGRKRKKQVSEKEGYEVPVTTATNKSCKR